MLSPRRDAVAAKNFLRMALWRVGGLRPRVINVDGHPAYPQAIRELKASGELSRRCRCRPSAYLNNALEQDHRRVKQRIRPMLGFKRFDHAAVTISGIELAKKIKKGQFKTGKLGGAE